MTYTAEELAQHMENDCMLVGWDDVPAMLRSQATEIARLHASLDDWLYANGPNGWIDALRDDAGRYRKLRSADMTTRNRLEHYSNSALDVVLDALPAVGRLERSARPNVAEAKGTRHEDW